MRFIVCEEPAQILEAQKLRYEVFCIEKSWVEPEACADGVEADRSDPLAVHFLALEDEVAVGTVRLLLGWCQELPATAHLDLASLELKLTEIVEVSRLATKRGSRSQNLKIFLGLTTIMWEWATEHSAKAWLAIADVPLYHMLTRLGLPVILQGEPLDYLGSRCIPVAFDMPGTGPVLRGTRR